MAHRRLDAPEVVVGRVERLHADDAILVGPRLARGNVPTTEVVIRVLYTLGAHRELEQSLIREYIQERRGGLQVTRRSGVSYSCIFAGFCSVGETG